MENALDKALANASLNARMNGDTLHTENLDSIADPEAHQEFGEWDAQLRAKSNEPNPDYPNYVVVPKPPEYDPKDVAFKPKAYVVNDSEQDALLYAAIKTVDAKVAALTDHIVELKVATHMISTTITNAASMQSESNHKHRSLHEWDDSTLLNELVERENDLMPFYFELLKRIPQNLQGHVDESMKGKYQSLGVLSKLCAALSYVQQPQPTQAQQMSDIIQQLNQPSAEDIARVNRNPDKYGSPTYPQSDNQPTILNEYRAVPKLPFVNGMINPYPQS